MQASGLRGSMSVNAPGQNSSASFSARLSKKAIRRALSMSFTCTISGLMEGLPFTSNILATARSLLASAPSPYTVFVGNATRSPAFRASAAKAIFSGVREQTGEGFVITILSFG